MLKFRKSQKENAKKKDEERKKEKDERKSYFILPCIPKQNFGTVKLKIPNFLMNNSLTGTDKECLERALEKLGIKLPPPGDQRDEDFQLYFEKFSNPDLTEVEEINIFKDLIKAQRSGLVRQLVIKMAPLENLGKSKIFSTLCNKFVGERVFDKVQIETCSSEPEAKTSKLEAKTSEGKATTSTKSEYENTASEPESKTSTSDSKIKTCLKEPETVSAASNSESTMTEDEQITETDKNSSTSGSISQTVLVQDEVSLKSKPVQKSSSPEPVTAEYSILKFDASKSTRKDSETLIPQNTIVAISKSDSNSKTDPH